MGTPFPVERDCGKGEDRLSEVPDDILMSIVSTMGMKEAAKTSILSKRWRYLWAKGTHLDFNKLTLFPGVDVQYLGFPNSPIKKKFINWVNQIVALHSSPYMDTFRVCFGFERSDAHHIDKWVRFAISKKVKNLELTLLTLEEPVYNLTFDINDSGIRFLQSLCLNSVNVSGDILEYVLAQCRSLERLHIELSEPLVRLKVVGLCPKLKHLTILHCFNLKQVEIEAVNLVYLYLSVKDHWSNVVFKNIPNLVDAKFDGTCVSDFVRIFRQNSHLAQISKLSLDMKLCVLSAGSLPTFCNLNQLTMMSPDECKDELASVNQFLKACPKLSDLKVQFTYYDVTLLDEADQLNELDSSGDDDDDSQDWEYFERCYEMELEPTGHPNLKEFQLAGFCGCAIDVELILFILLISYNLETIICDCSQPFSFAGVARDVTRVLKSRAAKLVKLVPPKITLVII